MVSYTNMADLTTREIIQNAWKEGIVVPAFNIPYLPVMKPVVEALKKTESFALIQVARPEWMKFQAKSLRAIREEYEKWVDRRFTRLHLDHVPVLDEDFERVDFEALLTEAIDLGYESLMVDGSRLPLEENIESTKRAVDLAKSAGLPIEAELGAVLGHEAGPLPPYEELFASGQGFTDPEQAERFISETGADWLSVAIGNIHGAISGAAKSQKKLTARLNIEHLESIGKRTGVPLVLHGGTGIGKPYLLEAFQNGIAKINIGTAIRQSFERGMDESIEKGQQNVFETTVDILTNGLEISRQARKINPV